MLVAVGSHNPVKIAATAAGFTAIWPDAAWQVQGMDVPSGVSVQPMSNAESIRGARSRATLAREGLWYTTGWVVIVDRYGREGLSSSMVRPVPLPSLELVLRGVELGVANDQVFGRHNSKQGTGLIGLLTNDVLTRQGVFRDAVISALARFLHPDHFEGLEAWAAANGSKAPSQTS